MFFLGAISKGWAGEKSGMSKYQCCIVCSSQFMFYCLKHKNWESFICNSLRSGGRKQVLPSAHSRKSSMICSERNSSSFSVHADRCHWIRYGQHLLPAASVCRISCFVVAGEQGPCSGHAGYTDVWIWSECRFQVSFGVTDGIHHVNWSPCIGFSGWI